MTNELDLPPELVADGLALGALTADAKAWPALVRLLDRMNAAAITTWENDKTDDYSKKWLRGYRQALGDLQQRITEMAKDATAHTTAKELTEVAGKTLVDEGFGSGDVAIA